MSVTSLSANPFYEALALVALPAVELLHQDEEMVGVAAQGDGDFFRLRRKFQYGRGDDTERALEELTEAVAGVVLAQTARS
jgi:hypothetical protein